MLRKRVNVTVSCLLLCVASSAFGDDEPARSEKRARVLYIRNLAIDQTADLASNVLVTEQVILIYQCYFDICKSKQVVIPKELDPNTISKDFMHLACDRTLAVIPVLQYEYISGLAYRGKDAWGNALKITVTDDTEVVISAGVDGDISEAHDNISSSATFGSWRTCYHELIGKANHLLSLTEDWPNNFDKINAEFSELGKSFPTFRPHGAGEEPPPPGKEREKP